MKKLSLLLLVLIAATVVIWRAPLLAAVRPPKLEYQRLVLPNGLVVILHQDKSTPITHVEIWYHVGSKNEKPGRTGFAHFFEHLMFKGSRNVEPEQHTSIIASVGGQANAYTNEDTTVFWQTIPAQYLPLILWMEADRMASLRIDQKTFVTEREVVKEERRMRIENPPFGTLNELIMKNAFDVHPYRHPVIGSMDDLNAATVEDVRDFYKTYYVPENATMMIVGDFDTDTAVSLVNQYFGRIPKSPTPVPRDIPQEPKHTKERRVTLEEPWPLPAVVVAYQVPYNGHPESYPMFVMSKTLSDGQTSRIYRKLVYETGLALTAFGSSSFLEDPGIFSAVALVNPGKSPDEVEKALIAEFDKLKTEGITERELQRAKNQFARDYIVSRLSIKEKASQLGHAEVIQKDMATADGEFDTFQKVSLEDVKRVAQKYFVPEGRLVMRIMPRGGSREVKIKAIVTLGLFGALTAIVAANPALKERVKIEAQHLTRPAYHRGDGAQARVEWPRENPPRPLPARPVSFPPYEIKKLANGMQVVLVSQNEQPAISVRMIIRAGAALDPKGRYGLAMMTASLLDQGAGKRTAEQIADTIDFVGGALGTGAGADLSFVNAVVMKDSYDVALDLIADLVQRPTFTQEEIDRQRAQALSALKVAADDPESVADRVIDRLIYGFHPYGMPGAGTAESLAALTREDFVDFHKKYFVPNNALIAVVGDINSADAMAGLEQHFGAWKAGEVPATNITDPPEATRRVVVIDKKGAVQTEIRVGQIAIPRKHADFEAIDQAVKILGGEGANRLQQVLRSQKQLTYGASADLNTYKWSGAVVAETDTQTPNTAEALRVVIDEFTRLQRERVSDGELEGAQDYMIGHFPLTIEVPDAIATQVLNQLFYELPVEELPRYRERILKVTPDEIQRVAKWFIRPSQLSVVLVGDADKFVNDLKGVGLGTFERIPIERLDLLSADLTKRPGTPKP